MSDFDAFNAVAHRLDALMREAGDLALRDFRAGSMTQASVTQKTDGSPVTSADLIVDRFLRDRLTALAPDYGWLSEETEDMASRLTQSYAFIVDPIDGTRGFVNGDPSWAICVACVAHGRPVLAAIHAPALNKSFFARAGEGAFCNGVRLHASSAGLDALRLSGPERQLESLRQSNLDFETEPRGPSLALRLTRVASGELEGAFAAVNAKDWDLAAADLLVQEAGGLLTDLDGNVPLYNQSNTAHPALLAAPIALHGILQQSFQTQPAD